MKKPGKMKPGHVTGERAQGKAKGTGVDKPMKKASAAQVRLGVTSDIWAIIGEPIGSQDDGLEFGVDLIAAALTDDQFIGLMPPINPITPAYRWIMEMQS